MNENLKIIISAEIDKLKKGVQAAKGEIQNLAGDSEKNASKVKAAFEKMGQTAKDVARKLGTAFVAVAGALAGTALATQEYRDDIAKLNTAFQAAGYSTKTAETAYRDLYSVLGETDQAVEASQQIAMLANSEEDVAKWSELAGGLVGRFSDSLQPETFFEAANETLSLGEATGAYVQMLEGCHMSVDEFNEGLAKCRTEEEKQAYILEWTNKALGEHAELFKKNNEAVIKQREANMKLQSSLALIGGAMAPVVTAFTEFAAKGLAAIAPYIADLAEKFVPKLQVALDAVAGTLEKAFKWASEHKALMAVLGGFIVVATTALIAYNAAQTISAGLTAAKTSLHLAESASLWAVVAAQTAAIAPYLLIVAAITAFIAIVVKAYKENETFRAIVDKVFKNIKDIITKTMDIIKNVISTVWSAIKTIWDGGLKQILEKVLIVLASIVENFTSKLNAVLTFVSAVFKAVTDVIKSNLETAKTIVTNVIQLIKGIFTGDFGAVKEAVANILDALVNNFKTKLNSAKTIVKGAVDAIKGFFKFKWSLPKPSIPKFSVSGGKAPWGFGGKGSLPKISIRWNKLGGIFDKPTLFNYGGSLQGIGEDGAEAVVPLEKNTKWLDKLADKLVAKQGTTPIVLQVDGKTFAQVSIDSINALTRQRGNLGLNII